MVTVTLLLGASLPARADVYKELFTHIQRSESDVGRRTNGTPPEARSVTSDPVPAAASPASSDPDNRAAAAIPARVATPGHPQRPTPLRDLIRSYILLASHVYRVPAALIHAVIATESSFDPNARSKAGAVGLMQLMPGTASMMGASDRRDPRENVLAGTRYLRVLINRFNGDFIRSVAAYNAGPGAVERHGGVPPYAETERYVAKVLAQYRRAQALYPEEGQAP